MKANKLTVNTPLDACNKVRKAMADAGAGVIGEYTHCSFSIKGIGRSVPSQNSNPAIGHVETLNQIEEEKIETFCSPKLLEEAIKAIKNAHPHEELAITAWNVEIH